MRWLTSMIVLGTLVILGCSTPQPGIITGEFDINEFIQENYGGCLYTFTPRQENPQFCKDMVFVDCGSAADGPSYYLNKNTGELISGCGGVCRGARGEQRKVCETLCPPPEWDCQ